MPCGAIAYSNARLLPAHGKQYQGGWRILLLDNERDGEESTDRLSIPVWKGVEVERRLNACLNL